MWIATLLVFLFTWGVIPGPCHLLPALEPLPLKSRFDSIPAGGDVGSRLILTPYIEAGNIEEAQNLSAVSGGPFRNDIPSYSGFFTVNKEYNSNLFFWFFPAEHDHENAPVLLWLQGGPGTTSLFGLFNEIGPFWVSEDNTTVVDNPYSWHKNHSLIFIDNPVGTGFSFTDKDEGYASNQTQIGDELYTAVIQFFKMFPDFRERPFYISGESYAGKHVPSLGYMIHKNNPSAEVKVNLQGLVVGNGLTDPSEMFSYSHYVYQLGLVDTNVYRKMQETEETGRSLMNASDFVGAYKIWIQIINLYSNTSYNQYLYNILDEYEDDELNDYKIFIQKDEVRKALHVGDAHFKPWSNKVYDNLQYDFMQSVRPWLEELLEHYRVLYYSGQLDIIMAYPLSVNMYNKLQFSAAEEYRDAKRQSWRVGEELAGYLKTGGQFTEVLVRNAGHMVPTDQPEWAFDLINRFTRNAL